MISSFIKGKVYVFIDGANVFYAQRTLGWRMSYARLMEYLKRECDLGKCFVYIGKRVLVMSTRGHISKELLDRAKYVDLRKLKKDLILE